MVNIDQQILRISKCTVYLLIPENDLALHTKAHFALEGIKSVGPNPLFYKNGIHSASWFSAKLICSKPPEVNDKLKTLCWESHMSHCNGVLIILEANIAFLECWFTCSPVKKKKRFFEKNWCVPAKSASVLRNQHPETGGQNILCLRSPVSLTFTYFNR